MAKKGRVPTRFSDLVFRAKARGLQTRRAAHDRRDGIRRHRCVASCEEYSFVWAQSRSMLWSESLPGERVLQIGKVQNLRAACKNLNGTVVPASQVFSFWKQIGQATRARGFANGRLLREGCLVPAIGGGLCQLSNALYDAALSANLEIVERHAHSQIVRGSLGESGRDATVAWNYIDLRFCAAREFSIEALLTRDELIVRLRGRELLANSKNLIAMQSRNETQGARRVLDNKAHSCATCGQNSCFRHQKRAQNSDEKTAWLLDATWPEFQIYLQEKKRTRDELLIPIDGTKWNRVRYNWSTRGFARVQTATLPTLARSFLSRKLGNYGAARLQAQLESDEALALFFARRAPFDAAHVIVAQSLLPFLWRAGFLGGRTFEVLLSRLPLEILHARLDENFARHPERQTLGEFRAPQEIVEAESAALQASETVITPHFDVASHFDAERVLHLNWILPSSQLSHCKEENSSRAFLFSGPTVARKGAYEVREAARQLDLEVVLCGSELEGENFWRGCKTRRALSFGDALNQVRAVVLPALVEDNPRLLLRALSRGVPVVATSFCGLGEMDGVLTVAPEDAGALRRALESVFVSCF